MKKNIHVIYTIENNQLVELWSGLTEAETNRTIRKMRKQGRYVWAEIK